jgi:hypothetical protein
MGFSSADACATLAICRAFSQDTFYRALKTIHIPDTLSMSVLAVVYSAASGYG